MLGWIVRLLFVVSGFFASLFLSRDALNFSFIQMVISVILFTLIIAFIAFWPIIRDWIKNKE